jgi:hypothetical protein
LICQSNLLLVADGNLLLIDGNADDKYIFTQAVGAPLAFPLVAVDAFNGREKGACGLAAKCVWFM